MTYCKNCRYLDVEGKDSYGGRIGHWVCRATETIVKKRDALGDRYTRVVGTRSPYIRNRHNHCRLYHRKWWKFWVKS